MSQQKGKSVLVIDDEPHALMWLVEYLEAQGHSVKVVSKFSDALQVVGSKPLVFDLMTVDLTMPVLAGEKNLFATQPAVYVQFPGLYLARTARNVGYGSSRVIVYSVHDRDEIDAEARRIGVEYAVKGRPRDFKEILKRSLARK